ncbi:hypothetical protein F5B20DRAFT_574655 [Whalleya microplaca]|nr:hypothetical protein F5B20DRAFT_574655 [Whalleya microplaca]
MFSRRRWSFSPSIRHAASSEHSREHTREHPREHMRDVRYKRRSRHHDTASQERTMIELIDFDSDISHRRTIKIGVKDTSRLGHVTDFLKKRYSEGDERIPEDAQLRFFYEGKLLDGDKIPERAHALRYRVLPSGDDGSLRVIWRSNLRMPQMEAITREVVSGSTIGTIRQTTADLLRAANKSKRHRIDDANQIVVAAAGGLRPGSLQGSNWEARKVRAWHCRYLTIDVRDPYEFIVFRGFNEEYVWHEPYLDRHGYADVRMLRQWLRDSILASVISRHDMRRIDVNDIRLTCRGRTVRRHTHIRPGDTIDFELPRAMSDTFIQAEAWLVPLSEVCIVCGDDKRVSEMPTGRHITEACEHDSAMCRECVGQWISSSLDTTTWNRLKCPDCPRLLKFEDIRAYATRETFERYDILATKAALASIDEFKWCLNPRCNSGQIHPRGCTRAKCSACKRYSCVLHNVPWHSGESCEEYERRTRKQRKNDKASEKHVNEITKPCPGCNRKVNKYTGCDHVTCICGHEWCWLCFGSYYRDDRSLLQCYHKRECRYHDNPPNYEGDRAFMPFLNVGNDIPPRPDRPHRRPIHVDAIRMPARPARRPPAPPGPIPDPELLEFIIEQHQNPFLRRHGRAARMRHEFLEDAAVFHLGHVMQRTR